MPSKSYATFNDNIKQVDKLLQAFLDARTPSRGRKHLDHFTRAALLFLCSSWEVYVEEVAIEAGEIITRKTALPSNLPLTVQKFIASTVKSTKHELAPISFADNWKGFYITRINEFTSKLNTPKRDKIMELFNKYIGISGNRIVSELPTLSSINKIVSDRGNVAHNIYADEYLKKETVDNYYALIKQLVKEIEILLWNYLPEITDGKRPWKNTY